ncbi:uncharacterized protein TNCV_4005111 [Trichonephila clavipes]|nr:uncharacterized protein TNCV_4005111 [Trichonephila clavipes]
MTVLAAWIFHKGPHNKACFAWPPHLPDMTPWDCYLRGFIKGCVYVPPQPMDFPDLRPKTEAAIARISSDTLYKVWDELPYRLDVCRVTNGAHVEHV